MALTLATVRAACLRKDSHCSHTFRSEKHQRTKATCFKLTTNFLKLNANVGEPECDIWKAAIYGMVDTFICIVCLLVVFKLYIQESVTTTSGSA